MTSKKVEDYDVLDYVDVTFTAALPGIEQSCDLYSPALHPTRHVPYIALKSGRLLGFLHHHTARPWCHRRPHPVTASLPRFFPFFPHVPFRVRGICMGLTPQ